MPGAAACRTITEPDTGRTRDRPPKRKTAIVNDEVLRKIEIDVETAAVISVLPDTDAIGDIPVDDEGQVKVKDNTETAKELNIWGFR